MVTRESLENLAQRKTARFAERGDIVALALTGSLARGMLWEGSDLDFWGFRLDPEEDFEDGVEDGIYWEIDLRPLKWINTDAEAFFTPPPLIGDDDGVTTLEALWGCRVLFDKTMDGTLITAADIVNQTMADRGMLTWRAERYLHYGMGCINTLQVADPVTAILKAREATIKYGISAYWMKQGQLLSSVIRIPERLEFHPAIQARFCAIFGLTGASGFETFFKQYQQLPPEITDAFRDDMQNEIWPSAQLGIYDGALCHFRSIATEYLCPELHEVLALEADIDSQKSRILEHSDALLRMIEAI